MGLYGYLGIIAVVLDRFSTCRSTVKYSGRKAGRAVDTQELDRPRGNEECDLFSGKWVFDNSSYPLYNESDCPYMSDQLACHKHGRPDVGYQYWRWQPHNCNMKRYLDIKVLGFNGSIRHFCVVNVCILPAHSSHCLCCRATPTELH